MFIEYEKTKPCDFPQSLTSEQWVKLNAGLYASLFLWIWQISLATWDGRRSSKKGYLDKTAFE